MKWPRSEKAPPTSQSINSRRCCPNSTRACLRDINLNADRFIAVAHADGQVAVSFSPENELTASRRQPPDKGDGPDSNRGRAARTSGCERESVPAVWPVPRRWSVTRRTPLVHGSATSPGDTLRQERTFPLTLCAPELVETPRRNQDLRHADCRKARQRPGNWRSFLTFSQYLRWCAPQHGVQSHLHFHQRASSRHRSHSRDGARLWHNLA
jgi:hypothetical protein